MSLRGKMLTEFVLKKMVMPVCCQRMLHVPTSRLYDQSGESKKTWKIGKLNHIAIAVPDLDKASKLFRDVLGANVSEAQPQPDHGVYTVFIPLGDSKIELLHPLSANSPIDAFLEKNKVGGMHHICIEVSDLNAAIEDLKKNNIRTLGEGPKIGAHGKPVIFLHPKDCCGTLVELEQE